MDRVDRRSSVGAAILAGGRSRRMGTDKALLRLGPGQPTVLETILGRVRSITTDVMIVAPPDRGYDRFGAQVVADLFPDQGPLGGIVTALETAGYDQCLVLACDLPLLNRDLIAAMVALPISGDALVPLVPTNSADALRPQPLHAIYTRGCAGILRGRLEQGDLRLLPALDDLDVRWLQPDEIRVFDPEFRSFLNLNEPVDVNRVAQYLAGPVG